MEKTAYAGPILQFILLAAFMIIAILFLLTQQNTLKAIRREDRLMQPGWVWLQLIPLVGQIWQYVVIFKIAKSIGRSLQNWNEDSILGFADSEGAEATGRMPSLIIGICYCVTDTLIIANAVNTAVTHVVHSRAYLNVLGFAGIFSIICWIIYWVSLVAYKRKLKRTLLAIV